MDRCNENADEKNRIFFLAKFGHGDEENKRFYLKNDDFRVKRNLKKKKNSTAWLYLGYGKEQFHWLR